MLALIRFALPLLAVLTILFVIVQIWSRRARRQRLEEDWSATTGQTREDYIRDGLDTYDHGLRRKLIWGVYLVPICVIAAMIYAANFM